MCVEKRNGKERKEDMALCWDVKGRTGQDRRSVAKRKKRIIRRR
jgi:hypothetical protein